ncbi:hypothetical protein Pcinc_036956 [Petrolisthes cinctipes]|uniref:Uncharacterized protein n=1 Tax=Petrolisthes cinctipes TaxID=88211 RepID=A0AAE1BWW0_PETCI|nr:hypothetical protein Pcinc_036956 [Petrolisthes cinctipes]
MQPLDAGVFGPLKKAWTRAAKELEWEHDQHLTTKNIQSGFAKCGLVPFDPERPDYTKLEAAAAQQGPSDSPSLSRAVRSHNFYPEKSAGRGPKKANTLLDKSFAISSQTVIQELEKERVAKEQALQRKEAVPTY